MKRNESGSALRRGFTLLELSIVIFVIMVLVTIAVPSYQQSILLAREAVLRDNLYTLRSLIDQYTLDKKEAPQALEDLVAEGYLRSLPKDPITSSNETWIEEFAEDVFLSPDQTMSGIVDVRSGSEEISLDGTPYNTW